MQPSNSKLSGWVVEIFKRKKMKTAMREIEAKGTNLKSFNKQQSN